MGWFDKKADQSGIAQWTRQPGELARRIEAKDVTAGFLKVRKPFIVQDGVRALLMTRGRLVGTLPSGQHDVDGPFKQVLNLLSGEGPTVLLLVDEGDITLDTMVKGLSSREGIAGEARVRITLALGWPEMFYRNLMKDRVAYAENELVAQFLPELRDGLQAFIGTHKIDDLFNNAALRDQAALSLKNRLSGSLSRMGFGLVGLNFVEMISPDYQAQIQKAAAHELDIRSKGVDKSKREVDLEVHKHTQEHRAATADATLKADDSVRHSQHESRLKDTLRSHEQQATDKQLADQRLADEQSRARQRAMGDVEHRIDVDSITRDHARDQTHKDAQSASSLRGIDRQDQRSDLELAKQAQDMALDSYEKYKAAKARATRDGGLAEADVLAAKMAAVRGAATSEMLALGLGDKSALLELERINAQKHLTREQAMLEIEKLKGDARVSDAVANQLKERLNEKSTDGRDVRDTLERLIKDVLTSNAQVATARAAAHAPGSQTIVSGGGMGAPVVINPQGGRPDGSPGQT